MLRDVELGYVTVDQAKELFGVTIADGAVDTEATAKLRAR